ncbi:hypothetical protein FOXB_17676 [Fusarium oxysporum f. sp. conglutinans Fo5176]|nr:hypothetical protein FOXB_17676 [Fusarium oxysporum f. sp. conglutinans Fo5176]
MYGACM